MSWLAEKVVYLAEVRGIDAFEAVQILNDPQTRLVAATEPPHVGQDRAIGLDRAGRLLTVALTIEYANGENDDEVGVLRCHTAWISSRDEKALFNAEQ